MSLPFYMDEHVNRAITVALRRRGIDILTVQEDGMGEAPDRIVLDRAAQLRRVVFTRDTDFLKEAAFRQQWSVPFFGVVYAHQLRVSTGDCIRDLELLGTAGSVADVENRVLYLPL